MHEFIERLHSNWELFGCETRIDQLRHGDLQKWLKVLYELPRIKGVEYCGGHIVQTSSTSDISRFNHAKLVLAVQTLVPWRKGPFSFFGIDIESEWRSDYKWSRVKDHLDLHSKRILDVGSGNGYFGYRMLEAGANSVTGLDSSLLAVMQNALINHYAQQANVVVPVRFESGTWNQTYDTVFSMGVLYHQRDQDSHLRELSRSLRLGGTLVVESIVADTPIYPNGRYARMRNVWCIPSVGSIILALTEIGFVDVRVVSVTTTTSAEQRRTRHMPFDSLSDALSATDRSLTVEGYPAPKRAVILAEKNRELN